MIVMGLDLGITKGNPTGVAILRIDGMDYSVMTTAHISPRAQTWQGRTAFVARSLRGLVVQYHPDLLCYELPPYVNNQRVFSQLSHVGGAVLAVADLYNLPCESVMVQAAKEALTGARTATKAQMIAAVAMQFGATVTKDVADATGVALAGYAAWRQKQQEAAA